MWENESINEIVSVANLGYPQKIENQLNKSYLFFRKSGFQTPGRVPLDSSGNPLLFCRIYVSETPI